MLFAGLNEGGFGAIGEGFVEGFKVGVGEGGWWFDGAGGEGANVTIELETAFDQGFCLSEVFESGVLGEFFLLEEKLGESLIFFRYWILSIDGGIFGWYCIRIPCGSARWAWVFLA